MGKSFKAVFNPELFPPMPQVRDPSDFERKWAVNSPAVLANMAHAAYLDPAPLTELIERLGARKPFIYDRRGAQAFLAVWPDKAILGFRGSQARERRVRAPSGIRAKAVANLLQSGFNKELGTFLANDVLADLNFRKTLVDRGQGVAVHTGFLGELKKLWGAISDDLRTETVGVPVWATGHSLGAAMATIAGMRYPFEEVVTFGEPRVGIRIERSFRAKRHVRYVNGDDPVTLVPPEIGFGYQHHGEVVRICDPDGRTDYKYDHSIVYYAQNL